MNFDNKIKNILGKTKSKSNLPKFNFPKLNLPKTKGASLGMQKKWKSFNSVQRNFLRKRLPDSDGDRVPNKFDCSPFNVMRQDFTPMWDSDKAAKMTAARRFGGRNLKRLKKLGQGRDRIVYELDKDKVLKVAKNPGGLTQNTYESNLDYFDLGKHYETGLDYTVVKKNKPLSPKNKRKLAAIRKEIDNVPRRNMGYMGGVTYFDRDNSELRAHLADSEAFKKTDVDDLIFSTEMNPREMFANRQWGEDEEGNLKLNDAGAFASDKELRTNTIKSFRNVSSSDRTPWQLEEWQEVQRQRKQFRNKGKDDLKKTINKYPDASPDRTFRKVFDDEIDEVKKYNEYNDKKFSFFKRVKHWSDDRDLEETVRKRLESKKYSEELNKQLEGTDPDDFGTPTTEEQRELNEQATLREKINREQKQKLKLDDESEAKIQTILRTEQAIENFAPENQKVEEPDMEELKDDILEGDLD